MDIPGGKKVTIDKIAGALFLSEATVSKALRNKPGVSDSVRNRVVSTAIKMGYSAAKVHMHAKLQKPVIGRATGLPTIYHIAKELGLSTATVSRALNNSNKIKAETAELVLATAKKIGFILNVSAAKLVAHHHKDQHSLTTIYTLAKELKLSASTISRALAGNTGISAATRQKVVAKAAELNFAPNGNAVKIKSQELLTIGLLVPQISHPAIMQIVAAIEDAFAGKNVRLITLNYDNETAVQRSLNLLDSLTDSNVLIPLNTIKGPVSWITPRSLVVVGSFTLNSKWSAIRANQYTAIYEATKLLLENGCRTLLFLDINAETLDFTRRKAAFKQAHFEKNVNVSKKQTQSLKPSFFDRPYWVDELDSQIPGLDGIVLVGYAPSIIEFDKMYDIGLNAARIALVELEAGLLTEILPAACIKFYVPYEVMGKWCAELLSNKLIHHVDFPAAPIELPVKRCPDGDVKRQL